MTRLLNHAERLFSELRDKLISSSPTRPQRLRFKDIWSRREDLNTPPAEYDSAILPLNYTGITHNLMTFRSCFQMKTIPSALYPALKVFSRTT